MDVHTFELLDMLQSSMEIPEHRGLRQPCEAELRRRGVLSITPTTELITALLRLYGSGCSPQVCRWLASHFNRCQESLTTSS